MRLSAAANRFNNLVCLDGYTGDFIFRGQFGLFDDSKRDSEAAERRILSVAPDQVPPLRRVIQADGRRWIVGHGNPDYFGNNPVRVGYVVHEATHLAQVRTLEEVCLNSAGLSAWAGKAWVKNNAFTEQSSKLAPQFHIFFGANESVQVPHIVTFDGKLNVVRATEKGPAGTLVATCEEVPEPSVELTTITDGTWDPVTETFTGVNRLVRVLRLRWQSLFAYRNDMVEPFGPGDMQFVMAKSQATVKPGATITLSDGTWHICSAIDEGAVWLCRAARHG